MKTYISGGITGNPFVAEIRFGIAEKYLKSQGHDVVNPFNLDKDHDKTWNSYMIVAIKALLDCDSIYMLRGWQKSRGAKVEYFISNQLDMNVIFEP